ncbi:MAG: deoxyribose-phosphate aldolase [Eubacteriales bacterium]
MQVSEILRRVDHTLLDPTATWRQIQTLCDEGLTHGTASVCLPPCYVRRASEYLSARLPLCTVIGFPNGYAAPAVKCFEAAHVVSEGADELDMVINLGMVRSGDDDGVLAEIEAVRASCPDKTLKVIVETARLTEAEKIRLCRVVSRSGADYIKTSTGFGGGGATVADITLFGAYKAPHLKIKASGGIATLDDARALLAAGADRLGTSRLVRLALQAKKED